MFGNPVPGIIQAKAEAWKGIPTFRQVRTCADHVQTGTGCAQDFGNGREGEPVSAMHDGRVTERYVQNTPGKVGHGSLIMRVTGPGRLAEGGYWSSGYGHMKSFSVPLNAVVKKGQQIAVVGSTGVPGQPHLHCDVKRHTSANPQGVATDLWPLLDQNIAPPAQGADMIQGTNPVRIINRQTSVKGNATNFRPDPGTAKPQLAQYPAGTGFIPDFEVGGQAVAGSTRWLAGFLPVGGVPTLGYFHESVLNPLSPSETAGFTQAEVDAAVDKAEAEAAFGAATAVASASISEAKKYTP